MLNNTSCDVFEYNNGGYGVEIGLLTVDGTNVTNGANDNSGIETELTLHTELHQSNNAYQLTVRLIEVM